MYSSLFRVLFYSVGGKYAKVVRMDSDGRNQFVIVKYRVVSPNALALDRYGRRLYVYDDQFGTH